MEILVRIIVDKGMETPIKKWCLVKGVNFSMWDQQTGLL